MEYRETLEKKSERSSLQGQKVKPDIEQTSKTQICVEGNVKAQNDGSECDVNLLCHLSQIFTHRLFLTIYEIVLFSGVSDRSEGLLFELKDS